MDESPVALALPSCETLWVNFTYISGPVWYAVLPNTDTTSCIRIP